MRRILAVLVLPIISAVVAVSLNSEIIYESGVTVRTIAGSGFKGFVDGRGLETMFHFPSAMTLDRRGNILIYDQGNERIRMLDTNMNLTTLFREKRAIGIRGVSSRVPIAVSEDGTIYFAEGRNLFRATETDFILEAQLEAPIDDLAAQTTFICSSGNRLWKRSETGNFIVLAGSGNSSSIDGVGIFSSFRSPAAICLTPSNEVIIGESTKIRRFDQSGILSTIAGRDNSAGHNDGGTNIALFHTPESVAFDANGSVLFISGNAVRRVTQGRITTLAGSSGSTEGGGFVDGPGEKARFFYPQAILIKDGAVLVLDTLNNRLREIRSDAGTVPTPEPVITADVFAGITIFGLAGRTYRIEATPNLKETNLWVEVGTVTLPSNIHTWFDRTSSPLRGRRFYRAIAVP